MSQDRPIEAGRISLALSAILSSQTFARSHRLRTFLKFVVEREQLGLARQLKGSTIGMDVFSRDGALDPGVDALVRVQAGKLRRLINLYYADEGRNDPVRIRIPLGGYVPVYELRSDARRPIECALPRLADPERDEEIRIDIKTPAGDTGSESGYASDRHLLALPMVHCVVTPASDGRARTFDNALRFSEARLCAFKLAPSLTPPPVAPGELDFLLNLCSAAGTGPLHARLVHPASGETIAAQSHPAGTMATSRQIAAFANQFVARTLTLSGEVYAFCRTAGLSSPLMECLEATYQYRLENSHDAYLEASRHQQRLVHPERLPAFISELSDLLALTHRQS